MISFEQIRAVKNEDLTKTLHLAWSPGRKGSNRLLALPTDVLGLIFSGVSVKDLIFLEATTSKFLMMLRHQSFGFMWRCHAASFWGPTLGLGGFPDWRFMCIELERRVWPLLRDEGVKAAVHALETYEVISPLKSWATRETIDIVRSALRLRTDLECRRRLAQFVCSSCFAAAPTADCAADLFSYSLANASKSHDSWDFEWGGFGTFGRRNIDVVLFEFSSLVGDTKDPEEALRNLLLRFPFLPIDAGEGADRVIKSLGRLYLATHPEQRENLRHAANGSDSGHDDAESAVYILLYAVIMLNTDLHHPAIKNKIQVHEFLRSARGTVLGRVFEDKDLARIYRNIAKKPLLICPTQLQQKGLMNILDMETRQRALRDAQLTKSAVMWGHIKETTRFLKPNSSRALFYFCLVFFFLASWPF